MGLEPGEYLLTFTIHEESEKWHYGLRFRNESGSGGTTGSEIRCKDNEWPRKRGDFAESSIPKMTIISPDKPLKLLDLRAMNDEIRSSNLSHEGVVLWVDAVSNYESDFDVYE